ncbi:hypothetical protein P7L75_27960 [Tistrella mobilis]|uniref:hypothetical protein n=1 Tax=Tistrella mobilis TaxID=171437 RepID=UPI0035563F2D
MTTKQKLVTLELVAGIFGWGWLIAGAATLYYVVMAIGFGGFWSNAGIAFAVAAVSKWLAKGFNDNKIRVACEAEMISRGVPPEEAGRAWLEAYSGKAGSPGTSPESRNDKIIRDYASYIEANPLADEIRDVSALPHPKEETLTALLSELKQERDEGRRQAIGACAVLLADFQPGVGIKPLTALGIDLSKPMTGEHVDVAALAKQIANNPDKGRYEEFQAKAQVERQEIIMKVNEAMSSGA